MKRSVIKTETKTEAETEAETNTETETKFLTETEIKTETETETETKTETKTGTETETEKETETVLHSDNWEVLSSPQLGRMSVRAYHCDSHKTDRGLCDPGASRDLFYQTDIACEHMEQFV